MTQTVTTAKGRAHAFAASGALAIVAQTAREAAQAARALDDPACESLFAHIINHNSAKPPRAGGSERIAQCNHRLCVLRRRRPESRRAL